MGVFIVTVFIDRKGSMLIFRKDYWTSTRTAYPKKGTL